MLSITDAINLAHDSGWLVYNLFENETGEPWGCTLREASGGYRRLVCHGSGHTLVQAILSAIESGEAVLEREVAITAKSPKGFDIIQALGIKPAEFIKRI